MWKLAIAITLAAAVDVYCDDYDIFSCYANVKQLTSERNQKSWELSDCQKASSQASRLNVGVNFRKCKALLSSCDFAVKNSTGVQSVNVGLPIEIPLDKCLSYLPNVKQRLPICASQVHGFLPCTPEVAAKMADKPGCGTVFFTECPQKDDIAHEFGRYHWAVWDNNLGTRASQLALACVKDPAKCTDNLKYYNIGYSNSTTETLIAPDLDKQWETILHEWGSTTETNYFLFNRGEIGCASVRYFKLEEPGLLRRVFACVYPSYL